MGLWTGPLSCWKCYWLDLKSAGLFRRNLFLNSLKTSTPCLSWISYATQKLMLDSCKMVEKQSEGFHTLFLGHFFPFYNIILFGGARGVMVIVAGIGHDDTSSNPGLIAFHIALIPLGKVWIQSFSLQLWVKSRTD